MSAAISTDVLVVGAGPVGSLIGLGLARQGHDTIIIEKRLRDVQTTFGRATTLYPRSLELLEQVDLAETFLQAGFIARTALNFRNGRRVNERGWQSMFEPFRDSFHDCCVNIRQKNSEELILKKYRGDSGKDVWYGWKLETFQIDEGLQDGYNVSATLSHVEKGNLEVRCKYIIGADGGSSTVRHLANIQMEGSNTVFQWIRMDGKMKTSMPDANIGFAAVETAQHGNVLWVKLDEDAHRIGFAVTPPLLAKYPNGITEQDAIKEAGEAMKPFTLQIERLDWWTQYRIRQTVATTLQHDKYVLLAGDAAHTHSSGFAQGMNTGIHDSMNLVWKLSGVLKGWYKPDVLTTYNSERHAAAKQLISIDMEAASLITGNIPEKYQPLGLDADTLLMKVQNENMRFTSGLGVKYTKNFLNKDSQATVLDSGSRAPDALIRGPGVNVLFRLPEKFLHAQPSGWSVLVFAGDYRSSRYQVNAMREHTDRLQKRPGVLRVATILSGPSVDSWTAFGGPPLGKLYFDADGSAHARYGVSLTSSAVVVIRPDSIIAFATTLDQGGRIEAYFDTIFQ
ncbi:hypothetical protein E8E13_000760 [Curvularia kusanoi]|uniref:FAD-binding domain-containing protein n=1 Tax=Curvularia kusanoi TaxID=90978 RepID=A0A9P4W7J9_CURKU|nr:hypothetical protein E8E13_000760 [Curvularia kusanoi]